TAQRRLAHDSDAPPRGLLVCGTAPLRDGRAPRWVVGGRRYEIVPQRTLGIFTDQLKIAIEDWTQTLRGGAVSVELTGSNHTSCKGERGSWRIDGAIRPTHWTRP